MARHRGGGGCGRRTLFGELPFKQAEPAGFQVQAAVEIVTAGDTELAADIAAAVSAGEQLQSAGYGTGRPAPAIAGRRQPDQPLLQRELHVGTRRQY